MFKDSKPLLVDDYEGVLSGKLTSPWEHGPFTVDLPIKDGDFP